ncbi:ribose transport system ATP-binding protein [Bradyrhizobium sp. F1.13.4]
MREDRSPILELQGITKSFGGVEALRGVDFALLPGEIHGLVGENGAGKSTLMKIIAGVHTEFSGRFLIEGQETHFRSARDAHSAGIAMVHQELSVAPDLTVAENVFLGNQPTNRLGLVQWRRMAREAGEQLARFGIDVDPMSRLGDLPIGLQQLIEIARVLFSGARIVILDEPTSALSPPEVERLFATLRRLREEGTAIVFISHFIEDILRVSDTVTVFRNGRKVAETASAATSKGALIEAMIGRGGEALEHSYSDDLMLPRPSDSSVVLKVDQLSLARSLKDISFEARAGEVLGIYGFMGCGQQELSRILFGKLKPDAGTLAVEGKPKHFASTAAARRAGVALVPESRRAMLFHQEPVLQEHLDQHSRSHLGAAAQAGAGARHRKAPGRAAPDQAAGRRPRSRHALRRQSAESRSGEMADLSAQAPRAVRAHPRHGCRRQERRHQHRPRSPRQRARDHRAVDRAGNGVVAGRPHPRAQARRIGARIQERAGQQGPPAGSGVTEKHHGEQ